MSTRETVTPQSTHPRERNLCLREFENTCIFRALRSLNSFSISRFFPGKLYAIFFTVRLRMVALSEIIAHNESLRQHPWGLVALFVGATSGIGLATLRVLAKSLPDSRLYVVGRSKERFASELSELERLSDSTEIIFIEAEISLIRNTNKIVACLSSRESKLDLLYMSPGNLAFGGPHCMLRKPAMSVSLCGLTMQCRYR